MPFREEYLLFTFISMWVNSKARVRSVLNGYTLPEAITGMPTFYLERLDLNVFPDISIAPNLRLGHLVERLVGDLIKSSNNYQVLQDNVQILEGKITIGELDFLIQNRHTNKTTHVELAYKFYLLDPTISPDELGNWIGPNRNDSLLEKLQKLKAKQFPLLHDTRTRKQLPQIDFETVDQALCLLVSFFVPFQYNKPIAAYYQQGVKGYYLKWNDFKAFNHASYQYAIPNKKEWGMDPKDNTIWSSFNEVKSQLEISISEKQSLLVWQKEKEVYSQFFVTWW
ncbi:MAG: DUF1853 family protein [Salibacteraceae bacterium]